MDIYHVLINALSTHTIHITLNTIFYIHIDGIVYLETRKRLMWDDCQFCPLDSQRSASP